MRLDLVWIIYKSDNQYSEEEAVALEKTLARRGSQVVKAKSGLSTDPYPDLLNASNELPDLAIILGGDGTVLGAARHLAIHDIPLLSFNVGGHLGFLTHDQRFLRGKNPLRLLIEDRYVIDSRMMLEASFEIDSLSEKTILTTQTSLKKQENSWALNDFYFRSYRDEISPTCSLEIKIDDEKVDQYKGDGLILATPTGSTAYAMATGGPILHPDIEGIIVSAICPMSLSSRPIVVPATSSITITAIGNKTNRIKLWKDGASGGLLAPGDSCRIRRAKHKSKMILLEKSPSYYTTLTQKLHWAGTLNSTAISKD